MEELLRTLEISGGEGGCSVPPGVCCGGCFRCCVSLLYWLEGTLAVTTVVVFRSPEATTTNQKRIEGKRVTALGRCCAFLFRVFFFAGKLQQHRHACRLTAYGFASATGLARGALAFGPPYRLGSSCVECLLLWCDDVSHVAVTSALQVLS